MGYSRIGVASWRDDKLRFLAARCGHGVAIGVVDRGLDKSVVRVRISAQA
jgi:hypothetical protein